MLYKLSEFARHTIEQELGKKLPYILQVRLVGYVKDLEHLR